MNVTWLKPLMQKTSRFAVKNAPHILMAVGTTASISGLIFAVKAAPEAECSITNAKLEKSEKLDRTNTFGQPIKGTQGIRLSIPEWIKATAKYYGPAAAMEALALGCFWAAHGIDIRRQAILSGLCATAEQALQEYQRKVQKMLGEKAEKEIRNDIAQDVIDRTPAPANTTYYLDGATDRWFIFKGQRFRSTYQKIKEAQNDANHEMIMNMYISELEVMWFLDPERKYLKPADDSGQVGWSVDNLMIFDISWGNDANHEPVGVITIYDKDGRRYDPSPGFSRLM